MEVNQKWKNTTSAMQLFIYQNWVWTLSTGRQIWFNWYYGNLRAWLPQSNSTNRREATEKQNELHFILIVPYLEIQRNECNKIMKNIWIKIYKSNYLSNQDDKVVFSKSKLSVWWSITFLSLVVPEILDSHKISLSCFYQNVWQNISTIFWLASLLNVSWKVW